MTADIWLVYSTFPNKGEALSVARALVENRLVACANVIDNVTSVYRWKNEISQEPEVVLIAKTDRAVLQDASEAIKRQHSYEVPCIVAFPVAGGYPPFMQWVADQTR